MTTTIVLIATETLMVAIDPNLSVRRTVIAVRVTSVVIVIDIAIGNIMILIEALVFDCHHENSLSTSNIQRHHR